MNFENIPITGLHMENYGGRVLYHPAARKLEQQWQIDEEAYKKELRKVREINAKVWEDSVTKLPAELYNKYRIARGVEHFRSLREECAWLRVRDDITGNSFWAFDLAQVVTGLRRMVDAATLDKVVVEVDDKYSAVWKNQIKQFTNTRRKPSTKLYTIQENSQVVEQYDKFMRLMYVFPSITAAAEFNKTTAANIDDAAKRHRTFNECWFRFFYDNSFVALTNCVIAQLYKGEIINKFISIKEASEIMEIPTYTIYRLLRNPTTEDKYECTWRKLPKN